MPKRKRDEIDEDRIPTMIKGKQCFPPRVPPNCYQLACSKFNSSYYKKHGRYPNPEKLSEMWKRLSEKQKDSFRDQAKNIRAYWIKHEVTPFEKTHKIKLDSSMSIRAKLAQKTKRPKIDPELSTRVPSGYQLFGNKNREKIKKKNKTAKSTDIMRLISEEWRKLDQSKKDVYIKESQLLKEKRLKEVEETKKRRLQESNNSSCDDEDEDEDEDEEEESTSKSKKKTPPKKTKKTPPKKEEILSLLDSSDEESSDDESSDDDSSDEEEEIIKLPPKKTTKQKTTPAAKKRPPKKKPEPPKPEITLSDSDSSDDDSSDSDSSDDDSSDSDSE